MSPIAIENHSQQACIQVTRAGARARERGRAGPGVGAESVSAHLFVLLFLYTSRHMTYTYLLELSDSCWYVGKTSNLKRRLLRHFTGGGSAWTRKHPPIALAGLWEGDLELLVYWATAETQGQERTRGAGHTRSY